MEKEIRDYQRLNTIAEKGGVVFFGEKEDKEIPVGELKQSFNLDYSAYNRSFSELNLDNAIELYDSCIIPLRPDTVMIHIGGSEEYWKDIAGFEQKYILLINHIQAVSKNVRIVVISVDDEEKNRHLKNISDSTHSEFQNLLNVKMWNPCATKEVISFVQCMGFYGRNRKVSSYDLAKIFFCQGN